MFHLTLWYLKDVKNHGAQHMHYLHVRVVDGPFAIINADDYYGKDAYKVIYNFLTTEVSDDHYAMVGYAANNTLTDHGTVTRGVCQKDEKGNLTSIVEVQKIARQDGKVVYDDNGTWKEMDPNALRIYELLGIYAEGI